MRVVWPLLCLVVTGCPAAPSPAVPPAATARWVSLSPGITETLAALGGSERIVAVSTYCERPAAVCQKPRVGHALRPDLEAIAALRPDRIIYEATKQGPGTDLSRLATVEELPWLTLTEIKESIERLGRLIDRSDAAARLVARYDATLGKTAPTDGPEVLLLLGYSGDTATFWFIKPESLHGRLVPAAGGRAPAGAVGWKGPPKLTAEGLVRLDPEWIVVLSQQEGSASLEALNRLEPLRAVKAGRVRRLVGKSILSTGPSILDNVDLLKRAIAESPP